MRSSAGCSMIDVLKEVDNRLNKYIKYANIDINKFKFYTYSWRIEEFIFNQLYTINDNELKIFIKKIYEIKDIIQNVFDNKYYKNMLNSIENENIRNYIKNRNKEFENNNLYDFIENIRSKKYYKLTAPIIYFGLK